MAKLTERRAKDRLEMARQVMALVRSHEFSCDMDDGMGPREVWVNIQTIHGLSLTVDFDGDSYQPDTHVLSWHGVNDPHKLSPSFAPSVNSCHWHKATDVCDGFESLLSTLDTRLKSIRDGRAFQCAA